jgi:hypothetical protein
MPNATPHTSSRTSRYRGGSTLLTTEADAHVTARLVPEAELKQRSPLPCTPSNETAAPRNLDHAPHVVDRPADGLFPSAKPTEAVSEPLAQPPSPQCTLAQRIASLADFASGGSLPCTSEQQEALCWAGERRHAAVATYAWLLQQRLLQSP